MKALPLLVFIAFLCPSLVPPALAGTQDNARIGLHLGTHSTKSGACDTWNVACSGFKTNGRVGVPYDAYLVVANADPEAGIAGLSCGIDYNDRIGYGVDIFAWNFCGALQFPSDLWPGADTGNRMTWDMSSDCQRGQVSGHESEGVHAVAGAFYLYAYSNDAFAVTPHPLLSPEELAVADCRGNRTDLSAPDAVGSLHFTEDASNRGFNPCTGMGDPPPDPSEPPGPPPEPEPRPEPERWQNTSFMLHVSEAGDPRTVCQDAPLRVTEVVTVGQATAGGALSYVYVLGTPQTEQNWKTGAWYNTGITALRFGIDYGGGPDDALRIFTWNSCGGNSFSQGNWPAPLSGNTVILDLHCWSAEIVPLGYFYLAAYAPATMSLVGFPTTGKVEYNDCGVTREFRPLAPAQVGWVSMGGAARGLDSDGCNPALEPCDPAPTPARQTTWGQLKARYRKD